MHQFLQEMGRQFVGPPKPGFEQFVVEQLRDKLGMQVITVGGVPASTHFAQVMVEADYRMKLIGIGLEQAAGAASQLRRSGQSAAGRPQRARAMVLRAKLRMRSGERRFAGDGAGGRGREARRRSGSRRQERPAQRSEAGQPRQPGVCECLYEGLSGTGRAMRRSTRSSATASTWRWRRRTSATRISTAWQSGSRAFWKMNRPIRSKRLIRPSRSRPPSPACGRARRW